MQTTQPLNTIPPTMYRVLKIPEIGSYFSNYKELCKAVGQEPKQGSSKIAQLGSWALQFNWVREGRAYRVVDKQDVSQPPQDRNAQFATLLESQIIFLIYNAYCGFGINDISNKYKTLIIYTTEGMRAVGLCNKNFHLLKDGYANCDINAADQQKFYEKWYDTGRHALTSCIERLHRQKYIYADRTYVITTDDNPERHLAPEETKKIMEVLKQPLLEYFGVKTEDMILRTKKQEPFYAALKSLYKIQLKINSHYKVYSLFTSIENLNNLVQKVVDIRGQRLFLKGLTNKEAARVSAKMVELHKLADATPVAIIIEDLTAEEDPPHAPRPS